MRILDTARRQYAVRWPHTGTDKFGKSTYGSPVELRVRWDRVSETFMDKSGAQRVSKSKVMFASTDTVNEDDVLWEGQLADLDDAHKADPFKNRNAWTVQGVMRTPTLRADDAYCVAML